MSYPNEIERVITLISRVSLSEWGRTMSIEGLSNASEVNRYLLVYSNCKRIHWESVDETLEEFLSSTADVIGWELGEGNYKKPAIITTDLFEISLWYEKYRIVKTNDRE